MQPTKSSADNSPTTAEQYNGFTVEERAAMKEHAQEQKKAAARRGSSRAEKEAAAERDVLAKITEMPEADRVLAERIHDIITTAAPDLTPGSCPWSWCGGSRPTVMRWTVVHPVTRSARQICSMLCEDRPIDHDRHSRIMPPTTSPVTRCIPHALHTPRHARGCVDSGVW